MKRRSLTRSGRSATSTRKRCDQAHGARGNEIQQERTAHEGERVAEEERAAEEERDLADKRKLAEEETRERMDARGCEGEKRMRR